MIHFNRSRENAYVYFHHEHPPAPQQDKSDPSLHVNLTQSPAGSNHIIHLHNHQEKVKDGRVKVNSILIWNNSGSGREEEKGKGGQRESKFKRRGGVS